MRPPEGEEPSERQQAVAKQVAQILIPATDTPGGGDVGADAFLILALAHGLDGTRAPDGGTTLWIANITAEPQTVRIGGVAPVASVTLLPFAAQEQRVGRESAGTDRSV